MTFNIKIIIKKIVNAFGFEISRINSSSPPQQLLNCLNRFGISLIFDIGANRGQFGELLRSAGYIGKIVSFEPLPDAHEELMRRTRRDPKWEVHSIGAVGDRDGIIDINISRNSVSSSILPMLKSHSEAAPNSDYIGRSETKISRLDSISGAYIGDTDNYVIKIDTQGFEWQVLDGAEGTLSNAKGVLCELSLVPLYEGQHLWLETIERLRASGFTIWAIQKGFTDPRDGRTLQIDAIFFRDPI